MKLIGNSKTDALFLWMHGVRTAEDRTENQKLLTTPGTLPVMIVAQGWANQQALCHELIILFWLFALWTVLDTTWVHWSCTGTERFHRWKRTTVLIRLLPANQRRRYLLLELEWDLHVRRHGLSSETLLKRKLETGSNWFRTSFYPSMCHHLQAVCQQ